MKRTCVLVAATLAIVSACPGQENPQAAREPRSAPGAGQEFLRKFEGEWAVSKAFYQPDGTAVRAEGRCRQAMIHDGRFLESRFVFGSGESETTGTGLIGFEPESGRFTSVWIDSRQTRMSFRSGGEPFDGERIVLSSGSLGDEDLTRRTRTVTTLEDGGGTIVHRQYALGAGGEERLMMELILKRAGG